MDPHALAPQPPGRGATCQDLVNAADRLAAGLRTAGVGTVAVTGRRGTAFVAAVLAAMAASVRLVTVDPALPPARRAFLLRRAGVGLVLSADEPAHPAVPGGAGPLPVCRMSPAGETADPLPTAAVRSEPAAVGAYVLLTPVTSGAPAAAAGRQCAVAHFVRWRRDRLGPASARRAARLTAVTFDVVLRDLSTPLDTGAVLCVQPPADPAPPHLPRLTARLPRYGPEAWPFPAPAAS